MGVFGLIVPVLTLGSISKRWLVPGWRVGWLLTSDLNGILQKTKVVDCIISLLNLISHPPMFIQLTMNTLSLDLPTSIRGQWMVPGIQRLPWEPINHSIYPLGSQPGDKSTASDWHCGTSTSAC
ncbi:hypothetical protein ACB098_02G168700 [Castanea mollissima]